MENMTISQYIKKIRQELNLTQEEFAAKFGIKRHNVAKYETGTSPRAKTLIKIMRNDPRIKDVIKEIFK
jgi:DNA-binding transcriptional regulator YiaG